MSKIRYAVSNRVNGKPPDKRALTDGDKPTPDEVLVVRNAPISEHEVWDEQAGTVRVRNDTEKLELERMEKIRELELAFDAAALAEFGGLVSVMVAQALLNPQDARVKRALDHYRNLQTKTNQAKDATSEQLKTIKF